MIDQVVRELLELPDGVEELNHYVLLGARPGDITPEALDEACRRRNEQLRRADPKHKRVVSMLAKKILEAREALGNTRSRAEYDHELDVARQQRAKEARNTFRGTVNAALVNGKLPTDRIPALLERAAELGVPDSEAQRIIDTMPKTASPKTAPPKRPHKDKATEPMVDLVALAQAEEEAGEEQAGDTPESLAPTAEMPAAVDEAPVPSPAGPAPQLRRKVATPESIKAKVLMGVAGAVGLVSLILVLTAKSGPSPSPAARRSRPARTRGAPPPAQTPPAGQQPAGF